MESKPRPSARRTRSRLPSSDRPAEMKAPTPGMSGFISGSGPLMRLVGGVSGGAGLLGEGGDLERPAGGRLQHVDCLLLGAGVELDQQVNHDPFLVVLVEADVGEELPGARFAQRAEGKAVGGLG